MEQGLFQVSGQDNRPTPNNKNENRRTIALPKRTKNKMTFEQLPLGRSIVRLMDACEGSIRNDAPDTDWFKWLYRNVQHMWEIHERSGLDDVFIWNQMDVYCLVQKMMKCPSTGAARHSRVSLVKGHDRCQKCRIRTGLVHTDHIHPRSKGGPDHIDNYQLTCSRCNTSKGNRRSY
jgi:hypothetical protein